jgi:hypothetical protein
MTTSTKTKTKKTKVEEPTMTVEEMREALDGEEKMVYLILSKAQFDAPTFLKGKSPAELAQYLYEVAKKEKFPDDFVLDNRSIPVTKSRRKYVGSRYGRYETKVTTENEGPYWVLIAYEPYTDEELLEKGAKLVAAKKKRDAAAAKKLQKKVDDFNLRARELGQPTITVEDLQ